MKTVEIDMARGSDATVDPRVAPNGTVVRAQNVRIDKLGRLVPRKGYVSLGTTVQGGGTGLVPFDLHAMDGDLVCLGNHSSTNQTGIRAAYLYEGDLGGSRGAWRTEHANAGSADNTARFMALPAADSVRLLASEVAAGQTDEVVADVAATADGLYTAMVSTVTRSFSLITQFTVTETATGRVAHSEALAASNPRVLAISNVFYVFTQVTTTISVRTFNPASGSTLSGATSVLTGVTTAPGPYDVAVVDSATDYVIAAATTTGYSFGRRTSAHAVVIAATAVATLASCPVSICCDAAALCVLNVRAVNGVELRTFNPTTGALVTGPTNIDSLAKVYEWVGICRFSSTQVFCAFFGSAPDERALGILVVAATHATTAQTQHFARPLTKPAALDGHVFILEALGASTAQRTVGLTSWGTQGVVNESFLCGLALDGAAKITFSAATVFYCPQLTQGLAPDWYAGVVTRDPRDKTFRPNGLEFALFSGRRRQGVASGGSLYLTGGVTTVYDRRVAAGLGFETQPVVTGSSQSAGGSMTALGVYVYQLVFRFVWANGDVQQSAPSDPFTVTLAGGNSRVQLTIASPYSSLGAQVAVASGASVFVDIYRTEAGGSIPRFNFSVAVGAPGGFYGPQFVSGQDTSADSVVQAGAPLYTQGADGSVSGRLPLSYASACGLIMESDGKIIVGRLERQDQAQLSIENRPGETIGFVNDDLFYVQNPERIEALCAGDNGRRYIFGRRNIRELIGSGPNSAGVGDLSEPVEIENRVGAVDWRSVCKTEHGVFFQSNAQDKPKIYLLPSAGGGAIDAGRGIEDVLTQYPVVTSATRHDEEQLLTFTLQNAAGTDGRIVHLDLRTSGMGRNGWQGRWLLDRVAALEGAPAIEIVEESVQVFPFVSTGTLTIQLPRGKRVGDRLIIAVSLQGAATSVATPSGYTSIVNAASVAGQTRIIERNMPTIGALTFTALALTISGAATAAVVRCWLLRGTHGSQAAEAVSVVSASATSHALPTLTPSWGSAQNLWLTVAASDTANAPSSATQTMVWRGFPTGFSRTVSVPTTEGFTNTSVEQAAATQSLTAAAISGATWTSSPAVSGLAFLVAVRPLASSGTPVRASTAYRDRLVVCSATDVLRNDAAQFSDLGSVPIVPEWEGGDVYPMGIGGAGRHLSIVLLGELLGFCSVSCLVSYDSGRNWTSLRATPLNQVLGYSVGQTVRLQWVPKRRKIEGVRVKFLVHPDDTFTSTAATRGLAMHTCSLVFEDLAGPSRLTAPNRAGGLAT